jgi:hypothetical protein
LIRGPKAEQRSLRATWWTSLPPAMAICDGKIDIARGQNISERVSPSIKRNKSPEFTDKKKQKQRNIRTEPIDKEKQEQRSTQPRSASSPIKRNKSFNSQRLRRTPPTDFYS